MHMLDKNFRTQVLDLMLPLPDDNYSTQQLYTTVAISVFDHWLDDNEAAQEVIFYEAVEDKQDSVEYSHYIRFEERWKNFYADLYKNTEVYIAFSNRIFAFKDIEEYLSFVILNIREQLFIKLILPKLLLVVEGNYDLTHLLHIHHKSLHREDIYHLVKKNGLFILS